MTHITSLPTLTNVTNIKHLRSYEFKKLTPEQEKKAKNEIYAQAVYSINNGIHKIQSKDLKKIIADIIKNIESTEEYEYLTKYKNKTLNISEITEILKQNCSRECEGCVLLNTDLKYNQDSLLRLPCKITTLLNEELKSQIRSWAHTYLKTVITYTRQEDEIHKIAEEHYIKQYVHETPTIETENTTILLAATICNLNHNCETCPLHYMNPINKGRWCIVKDAPLTRSFEFVTQDHHLYPSILSKGDQERNECHYYQPD